MELFLYLCTRIDTKRGVLPNKTFFTQTQTTNDTKKDF